MPFVDFPRSPPLPLVTQHGSKFRIIVVDDAYFACTAFLWNRNPWSNLTASNVPTIHEGLPRCVTLVAALQFFCSLRLYSFNYPLVYSYSLLSGFRGLFCSQKPIAILEAAPTRSRSMALQALTRTTPPTPLSIFASINRPRMLYWEHAAYPTLSLLLACSGYGNCERWKAHPHTTGCGVGSY